MKVFKKKKKTQHQKNKYVFQMAKPVWSYRYGAIQPYGFVNKLLSQCEKGVLPTREQENSWRNGIHYSGFWPLSSKNLVLQVRKKKETKKLSEGN